jgi:hypothetical protein
MSSLLTDGVNFKTMDGDIGKDNGADDVEKKVAETKI